MYHPEAHCGSCIKPEVAQIAAGESFLQRMARDRKRKYEAAAASSSRGEAGQSVVASKELYRVPCVDLSSRHRLSSNCIFWPRYSQGNFVLMDKPGDCMLELTVEESKALTVVVLIPNTKSQTYGAAHQANLKKVGISTAYFRRTAVTESSMPTPRAKAAFRYLLANNKYYRRYWEIQKELLENDRILTISSFDLFINYTGIECAMFPVLYPETAFTDTGILDAYRDESGDSSARTVSIGHSWTIKVCSGVRVYGENNKLAFFLYEKQLAMKYFGAHTRAQRLGITADILTRDSQGSAGYWEIVQDSLADLVRIQLGRCFDKEGHPDLYHYVRGMRGGAVWQVAFPNFFLTLAPAEWRFPLPYFLVPYKKNICAGSYLITLHIYYLTCTIWSFLAGRMGNRWFTVLESVKKTEYQGRGTEHTHIAAWVLAHVLLRTLAGNKKTVQVLTGLLRYPTCNIQGSIFGKVLLFS